MLVELSMHWLGNSRRTEILDIHQMKRLEQGKPFHQSIPRSKLK
jgi:hypothetical protein